MGPAFQLIYDTCKWLKGVSGNDLRRGKGKPEKRQRKTRSGGWLISARGAGF
jgi:hypothetical protein